MKKSVQVFPLALMCCAVVSLAGSDLIAQDRLPAMPGHENYLKMFKQLPAR